MLKLVITGPTAVGKTSASIQLAKKINAEIISSDSMQIYKKMDIGTAKPTQKELAEVPHHLISIIEPGTDFNASEYVKLAEKAICQIQQKGKNIIITGGTGLYLRALTEGLLEDSPAELEIRKDLEIILSKNGISAIRRELSKADPDKFHRLPENDHRRIIRALSFFKANGIPLSQAQVQWKEKKLSEYIFTGINCQRDILYQRIEKRIDIMLEQGLLKEVEYLIQKKVPFESSCWQAIGYRQAINYFNEEIDLNELIRLIKRDSRRYAKRQLTWFRKADNIAWFDTADNVAGKIYSYLIKKNLL